MLVRKPAEAGHNEIAQPRERGRSIDTRSPEETTPSPSHPFLQGRMTLAPDIGWSRRREGRDHGAAFPPRQGDPQHDDMDLDRQEAVDGELQEHDDQHHVHPESDGVGRTSEPPQRREEPCNEQQHPRIPVREQHQPNLALGADRGSVRIPFRRARSAETEQGRLRRARTASSYSETRRLLLWGVAQPFGEGGPKWREEQAPTRRIDTITNAMSARSRPLRDSRSAA